MGGRIYVDDESQPIKQEYTANDLADQAPEQVPSDLDEEMREQGEEVAETRGKAQGRPKARVEERQYNTRSKKAHIGSASEAGGSRLRAHSAASAVTDNPPPVPTRDLSTDSSRVAPAQTAPVAKDIIEDDFDMFGTPVLALFLLILLYELTYVYIAKPPNKKSVKQSEGNLLHPRSFLGSFSILADAQGAASSASGATRGGSPRNAPKKKAAKQ